MLCNWLWECAHDTLWLHTQNIWCVIVSINHWLPTFPLAVQYTLFWRHVCSTALQQIGRFLLKSAGFVCTKVSETLCSSTYGFSWALLCLVELYLWWKCCTVPEMVSANVHQFSTLVACSDSGSLVAFCKWPAPSKRLDIRMSSRGQGWAEDMSYRHVQNLASSNSYSIELPVIDCPFSANSN